MTDYDDLLNAPQQKRSQALTLQILSAAERVMQRQGAEVTIREVAAEAGVSLGGIYARFADREELLTAVYERLLQRLEQRVIRVITSPEVGSMHEVLELFVDAAATTSREDGQALSVLRTGANAAHGLERIARTEDLLAQLLGEAALRFPGEVKHADPEVAIRIAIQIVLGALTRSIAHGGESKSENWDFFCGEIVAAV